ncbi:MAG: hypothetical protein L6R40_008774 [Gallowayella cf. fulva]|nr:MAG: hypothetical protein L6R40_008774 [Xanthomendoza cf. fulva]
MPSQLSLHSFQPGLGTLSVIPPEIRSGIWQQLFLNAIPTTPRKRPEVYESRLTFMLEDREQRMQKVLSIVETCQHSIDHPQDHLSVLRASKQLYAEIERDLYHNRTLTVCFDCNEHSLIFERVQGKLTSFYIKLGNICVARELANLNFAKFVSINMLIEVPSKLGGQEKLEDLATHLDEFATLIRTWQYSIRTGTPRPCPKIHVAIRLHESSPIQDHLWIPVKGAGGFRWDFDLYHIDRLVSPLTKIRNAKDATINIYFNLRIGQDLLPLLFHDITNQMKSIKFQRRHTVTRDSPKEDWVLEMEPWWFTGGEELEDPLEDPPEEPSEEPSKELLDEPPDSPPSPSQHDPQAQRMSGHFQIILHQRVYSPMNSCRRQSS